MTKEQISELIKLLTDKGVFFADGLTKTEIGAIKQKFNVVFPPDLARFLMTALPTSDDFVNWRKGLALKEIEMKIRKRMEWPFDGMVFDIENNNFWVDNWGQKPDTVEERKKIARQHFDKYPKLVPVYSHRYIPNEPFEDWNPVFSVHQMDIIYYGYDLPTYFANEFNFSLTDTFAIPNKPKRTIRFWSDWTA
jgi:hypothetical protein